MSAKKKPVGPKVTPEKPVTTAQAQQPEQDKKTEKARPTNIEQSGTAVNDIFDTLGKYNLFLLLGLLLLLSVLVFNGFLFGDKPYCFTDIASDSLNLSYPYMVNYAEYLAKHGLPKWSFNAGMGQSIFPFFLREPFELLLFFAGKEKILGGLVYLEVIKIILSGVSFYYFLRLIKITPFSSILGSLFFAFSGFMIMGSAWYGFTYEALCLALFLVAFELFYQRGNWYLIPVVVASIAISMPFNLYVYGLFVIVYGVFRILGNETSKGVLKIGTVGIQIAAAGVIGLMLAGPFLLENIVQLLESPRVSGNNSLTGSLASQPVFELSNSLEFGTSVMRFFSNDILGSALAFKGWKNILEAGSFYCGLPCLVLMPQVFPFLDKRKRTIFIVFIAAWLLPIIFPYFRHAIWLFSGDYYRAYAFFVAIVFIIYAMYALDFIIQHRKLNLIVLVVTVVLLFLFLNFPYFEDKEAVNKTIQGFAEILILGYAALLFFIARPQSVAYLKYVFIGLVVFELSYISGTTTNNWAAYEGTDTHQKIGYNDYSVDAVKYISDRDKSFYRIDKSYGSSMAVFNSINDALAQGYYGTSSYNPFNQLNYIYYMQLIGVSNKYMESDSRWCLGTLYKPLFQSVNQVKYILAKDRINPFWKMVCDSLTKVGDVTVFRNRYVLPFGFTYSKFLKQTDYEKLSQEQKSLLSLKTCVVNDKDVPKLKGLTEYRIADTTAPFDLESYATNIKELSQESMVLSQFSDNSIKGTITLAQDKMVYFSVPLDAGWTAMVDGHVQEKIALTAGMTGLMLTKGNHNISLVYELRYFSTGLYMSLAGVVVFIMAFVFLRKSKKVVPMEPVGE